MQGLSWTQGWGLESGPDITNKAAAWVPSQMTVARFIKRDYTLLFWHTGACIALWPANCWNTIFGDHWSLSASECCLHWCSAIVPCPKPLLLTMRQLHPIKHAKVPALLFASTHGVSMCIHMSLSLSLSLIYFGKHVIISITIFLGKLTSLPTTKHIHHDRIYRCSQSIVSATYWDKCGDLPLTSTITFLNNVF